MAEKEYIEREALMNFANNHITKSLTMNDIARFHTADVAPVKHGHWIKNDYASKRIAIFLDNADEQYKVLGYPHRIILAFKCSECRMVSMVDESRSKYDFCPNCGAKMDE